MPAILTPGTRRRLRGLGVDWGMPISPGAGIAQFLSVMGIVTIPGLGIALSFILSKVFEKKYEREIHVLKNVTMPMNEALSRKDFVAATQGIRQSYFGQEPQRTHIGMMIMGWGPEQISRLQPQVERAMFTAMLGYAISTGNWSALNTFRQELQRLDDYSAPPAEAYVNVEGFAAPVAVHSSDSEGGDTPGRIIYVGDQAYRRQVDEENGGIVYRESSSSDVD